MRTATTSPPTTDSHYTVTETGRLRFHPIDRPTIARAAAASTLATLESISHPYRRLEKAVKIIDEADARLTISEKVQRQMLLSLALLDGALAAYNGAGLSRGALHKMTDEALGGWKDRPKAWDETVKARAKRRGVRWNSKAKDELVPTAVNVISDHARRATAAKVRDGMILDLVAAGKSHTEIAALVNLDRSRVTQIAGAAAKKATEPAA